MNDNTCGDQSTNAGTEQTEKTRYERNKDVNGALRMLEPSTLVSSFTSAYTYFGLSSEKVNAVAAATPVTRAAPAPRRGSVPGRVLRKW